MGRFYGPIGCPWGSEGCTSLARMGKFAEGPSADEQDAAGARFVYAFGTLADFERGLGGLIGPPGKGASATELMRSEHCACADSRTLFTTGNYGISTTSEVEWCFVFEPSAATLAALGLEQWPAETRDLPHGRTPRPLADFEAERLALSSQLAAHAKATLSADAVLAARLYTGPMFVVRWPGPRSALKSGAQSAVCVHRLAPSQKYNGVLRGIKPDAPRAFRERLASLCGEPPNVYATTLHAINAALVSMMRLGADEPVYRGMSGGRMPDAFDRPDAASGLRGGVETGCMSTTNDESVAMAYASADHGILLAIGQHAEARGASLSWLSQCTPPERPEPCAALSCAAALPSAPPRSEAARSRPSPADPFEAEITFPPLTLLEVTGTKQVANGVGTTTSIYEIRPRISTGSQKDATTYASAEAVSCDESALRRRLDALRNQKTTYQAPMPAIQYRQGLIRDVTRGQLQSRLAAGDLDA